MIRYKELLIRLPWFREAIYTGARMKLLRGAERGPCLVVLVQAELQVITDLDRKYKMTPQLPLGYEGQVGRAAV